MRLLARMTGGIGLAALIVAGFVVTPTIASAATPVVGHVYVNDNTAGTNTIAGFARHANGSLSALPSSPFAAGGAGTGTIVGSQGALQVSRDGRFLLAVDAGSDQISVLRIGPAGGLHLVGAPVSSGGLVPISIAIHNRLVYVANLGNGVTGSNYTGFWLRPGGTLSPLGGSTFALPATANPGDIVFNATGKNLAGIEVGTTDPSTFLIDSFRVGPGGRLHPAAGSPFPAQAPGPFGSEFSPTAPQRLYVSNAHGGTGAGSVSAFSVSRVGGLHPIGSSPFPDGQTAPCWVEITHDGRYLFTVNTGSTTISSYRIRSNGTLRYVTTTPFASGPGIRPFDARLDPSGDHLYVVDASLGAVSGFAVHGGNLHEIASSPAALPTGATPFGIVAT